MIRKLYEEVGYKIDCVDGDLFDLVPRVLEEVRDIAPQGSEERVDGRGMKSRDYALLELAADPLAGSSMVDLDGQPHAGHDERGGR